METDNFEPWERTESLPQNLYFYGLESGVGNITVLLKGLDTEDKILKLTFIGVLSYRVTQETARTKTIYENPNLRGFKVATNSEYLRWFKEESAGMFDDMNLMHYFISNIDNIIDIIGGPPVKVEWVSA